MLSANMMRLTELSAVGTQGLRGGGPRGGGDGRRGGRGLCTATARPDAETTVECTPRGQRQREVHAEDLHLHPATYFRHKKNIASFAKSIQTCLLFLSFD